MLDPMHNKPINVLKLNATGDCLASGGDDCRISLWDLSGVRLNREPVWSAHVPEHGAICSCVWVSPQKGRTSTFLVFGCVDGSIHVYRQVKGSGLGFAFVVRTHLHTGAVEDLAFDPSHNRLASAGDCRLLLWSFGRQGALSHIAETSPRKSIARSVCFLNSGSTVLVSFLQSHEVLMYDVNPWREKGYYFLPTRIGYAALGCSQCTLLVSNLATGIDVYDLPPSSPIRMFRHAVRKNVPILLAAALDDSIVLAGSDDGTVRVFDQRTGSLVTALHHSPIGTLVQVAMQSL
ncbi:hypothetical protein NP233_g11766 [Leucocoprinus birnbaumii]|uniref:Uncharacterized protein n=1 Tax=Leucocoprinus birnbaumii TaxID=56174 RepID=A0AAD5VG58_9AGAR|nr:hypothetical protein NP233_g11766 [Leucocoprinus birnbaumii]